MFASGIDITMVGLDVTHEAIVGPERVERFRADGTYRHDRGRVGRLLLAAITARRTDGTARPSTTLLPWRPSSVRSCWRRRTATSRSRRSPSSAAGERSSTSTREGRSAQCPRRRRSRRPGLPRPARRPHRPSRLNRHQCLALRCENFVPMRPQRACGHWRPATVTAMTRVARSDSLQTASTTSTAAGPGRPVLPRRPGSKSFPDDLPASASNATTGRSTRSRCSRRTTTSSWSRHGQKLSAGLHWLNGRYAREFNKRHGRFGHVFAERYQARVIESEEYLYDACAYVAQNPVAAGLCERPRRLAVVVLPLRDASSRRPSVPSRGRSRGPCGSCS